MTERSGTAGDDAFGGRRPTSHERMTGLPWDASYQGGSAPWDIGMPQPAIARVASEGGFSGAVLDVGCGTGENALFVASLGFSVVGVDVAETALAMARQKSVERGIAADFVLADAFHLGSLGRRFQTVLDCGLFHTCDAEERKLYLASLAAATMSDGIVHILCFRDDVPDTGPHPVSRQDLTSAFEPSQGWDILSLEPERILTRFNQQGAPAWLAKIKRSSL